MGIGFDNFGRPSVIDPTQTLVNNLLTTLFAKPGNFPSQPWLGMNITQYLMSTPSSFNANKIKAQLVANCSDFADCVNDGTFDIFLRTDSKTGRPFIVIKLPAVEKDTGNPLVAGVVATDDVTHLYRLFYSESPETIESIEKYFAT
jgi:hypothetical protein